ncbi:MAG: ABC transporter ATP-binding protein [Dissulfuribacterales bacterium]
MSIINVNPFQEPDAGVSPDQQKILIEASNLSVSYSIGSKREDIQSRMFNRILKRRTKDIFWALKDVSLKCFSGQVIGIIGVNGAGKTTLCRVMSGLLTPDTGSIKITGTVSALLAIGAGFNKDLSGRENIFLNGMMLGFSKAYLQGIANDIISFSGLEDFIDQPIKNYSSGMKARLGFSIAAMIEPDILILDEMLSTGDFRFSQKAGEKIRKIIDSSKLVLLVSHRLDFVEKYCTRAIWMDKGRIKADGEPAEVAKLYKDSYPCPQKKKRMVHLTKTLSTIGPSRVITSKNVGVRFLLAGGGSDRRKGNLLKKKRCLWALKDVDFSVHEGEILGIIGPNAAGKSTLCRVLTGILKPDKGEVSIKGKITALLSFGTGFDIQLTGQDNVYLNGMMLGFSRKEIMNLYPEIAKFSGIGSYIDQPVKSYSSGMKSRLGFSIAAMLKPDIFIIDEALNAGDIFFYEKASIKIQDLMTNAKATIVVTHNLAFVETVCTRVIWINKGNIVFDGEPAEAASIYRQLMKN